MLAHFITIPTARLIRTLILLCSGQSLCANQDTFIIQAQLSTDYITLDAKVEAVNAGTVSAQTQGTVEKIYFDINDQVNAGQVLLEIRDTQQRAALAQAKAVNEDAQLLLKRNHTLLKKGTLSQGEFDRSLAQAQSAQASVVQAQEQLSYTRVKAPYSGVVRARHVERGETVSQGQPLMSGFALQPLRAVTDIPASIAVQLDSKAHVNSLLISTNHQYQLRSTTLFPYADSRFNSVRARFDIDLHDKPLLLPGSWIQLKLATGQSEKINIPTSALLQRSELSAVYVKQKQNYVLRYVRTGNQTEEQIQVISGLNQGDEVAINALDVLKTLGRIHSQEPAL